MSDIIIVYSFLCCNMHYHCCGQVFLFIDPPISHASSIVSGNFLRCVVSGRKAKTSRASNTPAKILPTRSGVVRMWDAVLRTEVGQNSVENVWYPAQIGGLEH